MSKSVDNQRHEDSVAARIDAAKHQLQFTQSVLTAFVQGQGIAETATRLHCSRDSVWKARVWLGIQTGKAWRTDNERTGRRRTRAHVEELRP